MCSGATRDSRRLEAKLRDSISARASAVAAARPGSMPEWKVTNPTEGLSHLRSFILWPLFFCLRIRLGCCWRRSVGADSAMLARRSQRERRDTPAGTRRSQWCCQTGRREKPQITTEQPAAIKQSVPAKTKGKIYCPVTSNRTPPTTGPRIPATPYAVKIQP